MTAAGPGPVLATAAGVGTTAATVTALAMLAILLAALVTKVLLQGARRPPRRETLRLLDVVIAPLFVIFAYTVLERFRDLS
ncbi:hypothetical protein [Catellatospora sp. IY07-71]|uniref:hypothetical protein n=1 Tax=Catellatospora sp. IY07-71 TaxID=2728827 RepID=UPI001BB3D8C4|nr:hypothetical protein [Catellatospora sp. IY07-71]